MKNIAIIQARTESTRFPKKVVKIIEDKPVLQHVIERVKKSKLLDDVIVATTINYEDLEIVALCARLGVRVYCGTEHDVLDRYYQVAKIVNADHIVRITADCPLHDSEIIDSILEIHLKEKNDFTSNTLEETFPDGLDCEIMTYKVLCDAWNKAVMASEREHVTPYILHNKNYKKMSVISKENHALERWTLDTEQDFLFIKEIYKELYHKIPNFKYNDVLELLNRKPEIRQLNYGIVRNEGLKKSIEHDYKIGSLK